ncbi:acylaminoacyl-peptidase [Rhizobium sp. RU35A]|uniref:S9 family peptidase n=1 Tax=Rhizobium sp. RU35A TaxID=1907414 RepID=UPI000954BC6E|nr:S9 family peptidase [Rhizobium sp. RU35A]SIR11801.1 acylaminoacyl-peptidase [Rhizobium sp. RU35A]
MAFHPLPEVPLARSSLIPRKLLFGNPHAYGAELSPDGQWLTWLAPVDGVINIWIAPTDDPRAAEPLTRTTGRPITWQDWTKDGRFVLFVNDENGDENHHVFAVDPRTGSTRDLTPIKGISAQIEMLSRQVPGKIVVGLNDRDARWHDLHTIDLETGERDLLWQNTQAFASIGLDWQMRPRHARSTAADGGTRFWRIEGQEVHHWMDVDHIDGWLTWPLLFHSDNRRLLMKSCVGRNTAAFSWIDLESGAETVVAEHPRFDIQSALVHPISFDVEAVSVAGPRMAWSHITPQVEADFARIERTLPGFEFGIASRSDDDRRWIITAHKAEQAATSFLYDRDTGTITELFRARPELDAYSLAPMQAVETKSRDGLDLLSYLTLPASVEGERPEKPLPMVLLVHGGPWGRDVYSYRGDHQWLADRGYAVLSVNYRGSTGFGKAFVAASEKQHAAKMHDDLIDMVHWAIREGIADPARIAIHGGSYGGYASFVGATFTPDVFCCSVPVVGITNLQTLLESMPPYWAGFAEFMYRSYGDPRTEEGRALLAERSPIHKVDRITRPMLIFHGANDVRCKVAESDTIVAAMQAKGIPVTYVVYPDEGHGFHKPGNRIAYIAMAEAFFAQHLGGAFEPFGDDLEGSSHEIRAGAEIFDLAEQPV